MVVKNESGSGGEKPLDLFLKIGLDERTAKNTIANNKVTANLTTVIHEVCTFFMFICWFSCVSVYLTVIYRLCMLAFFGFIAEFCSSTTGFYEN